MAIWELASPIFLGTFLTVVVVLVLMDKGHKLLRGPMRLWNWTTGACCAQHGPGCARCPHGHSCARQCGMCRRRRWTPPPKRWSAPPAPPAKPVVEPKESKVQEARERAMLALSRARRVAAEQLEVARQAADKNMQEEVESLRRAHMGPASLTTPPAKQPAPANCPPNMLGVTRP